jgi:hypothetical protein
MQRLRLGEAAALAFFVFAGVFISLTVVGPGSDGFVAGVVAGAVSALVAFAWGLFVHRRVPR